MCATCGELLGREIDGAEVVYRHFNGHPYDHEPTAIPAIVGAKFRCDFCGLAWAVWQYLCSPRSKVMVADPTGIHPPREITDDGRWNACENCFPFVDRKDLAGLVSARFALMNLRTGNPRFELHFITMYWSYPVLHHATKRAPQLG